ncbi:MAG: ribosome-associated translation inhibitor RaiA, partial [Cyanobacteria bacterium]|nr:ribosome-associated translation inhibitor RaiA [Cyanobacteria bacterium GSL.Bin21]
NSGKNRQYEALQPLIKDAFKAARRQLLELTERQRNEVKQH